MASFFALIFHMQSKSRSCKSRMFYRTLTLLVRDADQKMQKFAKWYSDDALRIVCSSDDGNARSFLSYHWGNNDISQCILDRGVEYFNSCNCRVHLSDIWEAEFIGTISGFAAAAPGAASRNTSTMHVLAGVPASDVCFPIYSNWRIASSSSQASFETLFVP